jgi:hypothetical protein
MQRGTEKEQRNKSAHSGRRRQMVVVDPSHVTTFPYRAQGRFGRVRRKENLLLPTGSEP